MATAETTGAPDLAERRATVHQLAADGLSNRAIGRHLGIHHRTVARDLERPAPADAPQTAPPNPTSDAAPAPRRPSLMHELAPGLIQDLNVLVDRRTGALPEPLDRIVRAYADRKRDAWRVHWERQAQEEA